MKTDKKEPEGNFDDIFMYLGIVLLVSIGTFSIMGMIALYLNMK